MPRILLLLAVITPLCSVFLVARSLFPGFDLTKVAESFPISWPLAVPADSETRPYDESDQQPLDVVDFSPPHDHSSDLHASVAEPITVPGQFTRRIVAVGDLHGDFPNAQTVLQMAGVVDHNGNWTGAVDFLVQTGDIIDRGDDTIKLFLWMERLRDEAHAAGGTVLSHLGNHEWMNVIGDWRYVYPSEITTFGSVAARQKMLTTGRIGKSWASNYTTASRLPLHPAVGDPNTDYDPSTASAFDVPTPLSHTAISFVHGGLAPSYPDLAPFPSRINELSHSLLQKLQQRTPPPHPPNPYPGMPAEATEAERRLYDTDGPLWYRGWASGPEEQVCAQVDGVLQKTGTRRMIMGHTPDFQNIVSRCKGKIIIIDTGISHAYGGTLSALSITYTLTPIPAIHTSPEEKWWTEREVLVAVYPDRQEVLAVDERDIQGDFAPA
ncbi:Metallo-dependent phosphatase [Sparassis latifolia]